MFNQSNDVADFIRYGHLTKDIYEGIRALANEATTEAFIWYTM